jgi:uncharacterized protein (DUF2141 family)
MDNKLTKAIFFGILIGILVYSCNTRPAGEATTGTDSAKVQTDTSTTLKTDTMPVDKTNTQATPDTLANAGKTAKPLTVVIDNLASDTAPVEISIYSPQNKFPSPKDQLKVFRFKPTAGMTLTAQLPGITYGEYAIATYQDMDGDGKIGKNLIGIPTDPYGFSKNYHPKIKAPAFKDCSFNYDEASNTVNIKMIR